MPDLYGPLRSLRDSLKELHDRVIASGDKPRADRVTANRLHVNELMQKDTGGGTAGQVGTLRDFTDRVAAMKGTEKNKFGALFDELEGFLGTL